MDLMIIIGAAALLVLLTIIGILSRFKKCPSNKVMVIYGKTGGGKSAKCVHGGASFIVPIIQGYSFMDLEPLQFNCNLTKALSKQNIRVDVPTTVTVGISTEPEIMQNAAERLLGLSAKGIEELVSDIVYGQLRLIVSNMDIEQLNSERDEFAAAVSKVIGEELNKIGLKLININITDIRDEAGYIVALGQKDKAIALNAAEVEIAKAEKDGATKKAEQERIKNSEVAKTKQDEAIAVATANAARDSKVAEQQKLRDIEVAKNHAEGQIGQIEADKTVAEKDAELKVVKANAIKTAETARVQAEAEVQKEAELAQVEVVKAKAKVLEQDELAKKIAEEARAQRNEAAIYADKIVPAEQAKKESLLTAEAFQLRVEKEAEAQRNQAVKIAEGAAEAEALAGEGKARAIKAEGLAEAEIRKQQGLAEAEVIEKQGLAKALATEAELKAQADGFREMIKAADEYPQTAIQFKMIQEGTYENIARQQVEAFRHMNFGNIQIMDTSKGSGLTDVMQGLVSQIAPMLNVMKGMDIPGISNALKKGSGEVSEKVELPEPPK